MSQFTVYLSLPSYLALFLKSIYGDPIQLPRSSEEFRLLKELLRKIPSGVKPDTGHGANISIWIPEYAEKDPHTYNYLSEHGKRILAGSFDEFFWKCFFKEVRSWENINVSIKDSIHEFIDKNNLPVDSVDMLVKRYYRLRVRFVKDYNVKI